MSGPHGVLVVDKPRGPTSHDVVMRLRRALRTRAAGHCGTLDPMATGILVVALGEATKLVPWLTSDDKAYEATIRLGVGTDTLDAEGTETGRLPVPEAVLSDLASPALEAALAIERARTEQIPPMFSAIRIAGERAHAMARRGEVVDMPARPVAVKSLVVTGGGLHPEPYLEVSVEVAKGYFVRALARDLAASLGTLGHLVALRRTRSGAFTLADAVPLDGDLAGRILSLRDAATRALPTSTLTDEGVRAAFHGQPVRAELLATPHAEPSAWLNPSGRLVAIGTLTPEGHGQVLRGFPPAA